MLKKYDVTKRPELRTEWRWSKVFRKMSERKVLTQSFERVHTIVQRGETRVLTQSCDAREPRHTKRKRINTMKIIQKIGILYVVFCLMAGFAHAAGKSKLPDATLQLRSGSVAAGVGISWGKGTLMYKGREYPVSVNGLSLGKVGITKVTASGEIYHLKSLEDFSGTFTATNADITLAGGHSGITMKNQNGVVVVLRATSKGVDLTVGASGVDIKLKE